MGYISNFIVYTLAMVGVIAVALLVFKNATSVGGRGSSKFLQIVDSISLGQRKNLFIVSAGKEQFLIAGDVNNTCLISKLESLSPKAEPAILKNELTEDNKHSSETFQETLASLPKKSYMDKSNLGIKSSLLSERTNSSVMRNIAEIMKR